MPTAGTHSDVTYEEILDEVHELIEKYADNNQFIWTGDLNADPRRLTSNNDKALQRFCREENLAIFNNSTPTYHHFSGNITSTLDHIIQPKNQNLVTKCVIDSRDDINLSSHDSLIINTKFKISEQEVTYGKRSDSSLPDAPIKIKWNKVDLNLYNQLTFQRLTKMQQYIDEKTPNELIVKRTNAILSNTGLECAPVLPKPRKPTKFKWTPLLKPFIAESKAAHANWKKNGKPSDPLHPSTIRRRQAKKTLRSQQRTAAAFERLHKHESIMAASENDHNLFFQLIKQQRRDGNKSSSVINFKFDPENNNLQIHNWAKYYQDLATPKDLPHFDKRNQQLIDLKLSVLEHFASSDPPIQVSENQVKNYIKSLKNNKACDPFGVSA